MIDISRVKCKSERLFRYFLYTVQYIDIPDGPEPVLGSNNQLRENKKRCITYSLLGSKYDIEKMVFVRTAVPKPHLWHHFEQV